MAGSVEHLAVAWELLEESRRDANIFAVHDAKLFLLGNICPDTVMSRKGYTRAMKMHTHFRDNIADWEFTTPENLALFHERIRAFARQVWTRPDRDRDLYLGYLTHILTDEIFMRTVRPEFMKKISVLGLTDRDAETFVHFTYDVNQIDFRLGREFPGMAIVQDYLHEAPAYPVEGMVTAQELDAGREWILRFFFEEAPAPETPKYYTYARACAFVKEAVAFIKKNIPTYE